MHRDHPVLARGNPSDGSIPTPRGEFFRHIRNKSPTPSISPPLIAGFVPVPLTAGFRLGGL
jgi:hypothetical protein